MAEAAGVPGDAVALHAENGRLRMLLEDKDAQIAVLTTRNAELAERVARLERLISRNSGTPRCRRAPVTGIRQRGDDISRRRLGAGRGLPCRCPLLPAASARMTSDV